MAGFWQKVFRPKDKELVKAEVLETAPIVFTAWSGGAYESDIYRGAVDAIARNAGKLKGAHIVKYGDQHKQGNDTRLNRLLQVQPNAYMNAYDMLYKLVTHYYLYNNAFLYIHRERGAIVALYPITCTGAEFTATLAGDIYTTFTFKNGNKYTLPYADIVHLRRNYNGDELLGDNNGALMPALELAHTQNEGIINGIKSSANIRGLLKFTQIMSPEKLTEAKDAFINDYLTINNSGGVVATDQKMEYTPIKVDPATIDAEQLKSVQSKIYNYLGITERIVSSSYSEDEWGAFYESVLEPLAVQLSLEFTRKIFTEREQAFGNSIVFDSGRVIYSSNRTKLDLISELMPYGVLSVNQALEILNLPPVEDGDKRLQTLNVVQADKANEYQLQGAQE